MKTLLIAGIIAGLLLFAGIAVVKAVSNDSSGSEQETSDEICSSCPVGGCTAENNCGSASCGVVSGTGSCGCGR